MHAERALQEVNYITSIAAIHPPTPPHPPIQSSELDQGLFPRRPISINGQSALQQALDESFSQRHPMSVMDHLQDGPLALRPAIPAPPLSLDLFDFSAPHPSPAPPNPQPPHSQAPPRPRNVHNPFTRSETAYGGIGQTLPPPPPHPFNDARSKKDSSQFYRGRQPSDPPLKFLPEEIESSGMGWAMSKPSDSVNKSDSKLKDNTNRPPYEHQQPAARQIFGSSPEKGYGNNVGGWDFGDDSSAPNSIAFPSTPSSQDSTAAHQPHEEPFPPPASHRFDGSMARRKSGHSGTSIFDKAILSQTDPAPQNTLFKLRFALRGHLDTVRAIIFTGGGSLSEPEIASASDDGCIKRWIIPASYGSTTAFPPPPSLPNAEHPPPQRLVHNFPNLDIQAEFTHRAHSGIATCLAACPSDVYSAHGRAQGDGWIFSGGSDGEIRVWERGRVDPKAVLNGHEDAVWALCVLPSDCISPPSLTDSGGNFVGEILGLGIQGETVILISGSADGTVKVWLCSAPPPPPMHSRHGSVSSQFGSGRRGAGGSRRHSVSSGSNYPTSPQPNYRSTSSFEHELIHTITRLSTDGQDGKIPAPTCITPLGTSGEHFVVSYDDASIIVYSVKTGDEVSSLQSQETYNGSPKTGVNKIVTVTGGALGQQEDEEGGPTGERGGLEGIVMAVHEDRYLRFYDANSGMLPLS